MVLKGREISSVEVYVEELDKFIQIQYYYIGDKLIWQAVRSCFGAGFWSNEKSWVNEEGWKN